MLKPLGEEISFRSFYIACKGNDFSRKLSVLSIETSFFSQKKLHPNYFWITISELNRKTVSVTAEIS